jgi:hypothetical protein
MFIVSDRVKQNSITSGSGNIVLQNTFPGFQSFSEAIGDGNTTYYTIENNANFEVGVGTYNAENNALSRDFILKSTNSNNKIDLNGLSIIFCAYPADRAVYVDTDGIIRSQNSSYSGIYLKGANITYDENSSQLLINNNPLVVGYHIHSLVDVSGLQSALDSKQPSGNYAQLSHQHLLVDVSGLQSALDSKQPSGNYAQLSHQHLLVDVSGLQSALDSKQPSGNYSLVGHGHNSSDILDFNDAVSGLLPNTYDAAVPWTPNHTLADGTRYLVNDLVYENGRLYKANYENESIPTNSTLYWTDVGPGYRLNIDGRDIPNIPYPVTSVNGQTNDVELSTADLDDFANAVSGLIPSPNFTSLVGISGVIVTHTGTDYTVSLVNPTINLAHITDLSPNAKTFLLTPSSNNLNTLISDETGSGLLVFNNSPAFNGVPTVPTAASGTNTNQIASTSFVRTEISNLVDSAPSTLDTLNELAAALGDDPAFATTVTNLISGKVSKSGDVMTGTLQAPSGVFTEAINLGGPWNSIFPDPNGFNIYSENGLNINSVGIIEINSSHLNIAFNTPPGEVVSWNGNTLSVEGHTHTSSNITNFNSSVSGLLPVKNILGSGHVNVTLNSGTYTVSVSGLQPSGNYSTVGHSHAYTDITNFASGVDSIVSTSLLSGSYINLNYDNLADTLTINATGLQPSGNYSIVGHNHTSSNITDFNSSVSGLLPVKNVLGSGYIGVSSSSGNYTVFATGLQPSGNYANSIHSHAIGDVTGLQTALGSKADTVHTHGNITNAGVLTGAVTGGGSTDPDFANVSLLLHMDGDGATFVDSSLTPKAITAFGNAMQSTAQSQFGGKSAYFGGSGDYISLPLSSAFSPVGSAMTIECWLRPDDMQSGGSAGSGNAGAIVSLRNGAVLCGYEFSIRNDKTLQLLAYDGSFWALNIPTAASATALVPDQWSHVALVITSTGSTTLYINGVADASFANINVPYVSNSSDTTVFIGAGGDGFYRGYIDELRVIKGTAVYTANFTPPTAPFSSSAPPVHNPLVVTNSSGLIVPAATIPATAVSGLASVATSASYNDLIDKPTISILSHNQPTDITGIFSNVTKEYVYIFNAGSENVGLILPTAVNNKSIYTLKNNTLGTVYLKTTDSETIDGYDSIGLNRRYSSVSVISNGSNWIIV